MALVALDGRFVRVNRALCEIVGYATDELERLTFQDITHPEDPRTSRSMLRSPSSSRAARYRGTNSRSGTSARTGRS
jgi:PAS domain S-box-containing protein